MTETPTNSSDVPLTWQSHIYETQATVHIIAATVFLEVNYLSAVLLIFIGEQVYRLYSSSSYPHTHL